MPVTPNPVVCPYCGVDRRENPEHVQDVETCEKRFRPKTRVIYIPTHAKGDRKHADCEHGAVSSFNGTTVFVKFDKQVANLGWEGTTAQGCNPNDLVKV